MHVVPQLADYFKRRDPDPAHRTCWVLFSSPNRAHCWRLPQTWSMLETQHGVPPNDTALPPAQACFVEVAWNRSSGQVPGATWAGMHHFAGAWTQNTGAATAVSRTKTTEAAERVPICNAKTYQPTGLQLSASLLEALETGGLKQV